MELGDNPSTQKGDKGRGIRAGFGNGRVTLNEFRTPHSKLFGENTLSTKHLKTQIDQANPADVITTGKDVLPSRSCNGASRP